MDIESRPGFGLIGTGFMGKAHAIALSAVSTVFADCGVPRLVELVDADAERATRLAGKWGFSRGSGDWEAVCQRDDVDVVDICTPNHLHVEMALAAIRAGKHVYCEKPLALTASEAKQVTDAAEKAGVCTSMGFNYMCNPLIGIACSLVEEGELGDILHFRGSYFEDYLADPGVPFNWRCLRAKAGPGALADLGTHLLQMAEYLLGPIARVSASLATRHKTRRDPESGEHREVENEDVAHALVEFDRGCSGTMDISRIATGTKCALRFEIYGTKGSLSFDQERMNEIRLYRGSDPSNLAGYRTILAGPGHPDYAAFCPAPGHGLGINDLKIIEVRNFLRGITHGEPVYADFRNGWRVQAIVDAIERSHEQGAWVGIESEMQ